MSLSKNRISSPLEAGTSILDAHNLPSHVLEALEYASRRLARKQLHVALIVVRKESYSPSSSATSSSTSLHNQTVCPSPLLPCSPPPTSPSQTIAKLGFAASLKQRLRSHPILPGLSSPTTNYVPSEALRSAAASPAFSVSSVSTTSESVYSSFSSAPSRQATWPLTPATPATPFSVPPMTPCSTASVTTDSTPAPVQGPCGIRLVYAEALGLRDEKAVRDVLIKAERKFNIGADWLPWPLYPAACGLTDSIIRRSLIQNEILFASEGLTLFSLDRLYTFKSTLSSYSRTGLSHRLEDAVDELRRLYLANGGRKVSRSDVLRSYDWLSVTDSALADVDKMYRRAYGGIDGIGAIEGMGKPAFVDELRIEIEEAIDEMVYIQDDDDDDVEILSPTEEELNETAFLRAQRITAVRPFVPSPIREEEEPVEEQIITRAMASFKLATPSPLLPKLTLQTNFDKPSSHIREKSAEEEEGDEDEDLTARPRENTGGRVFPLHMWQNVSIDEMMLCQTPGGPMSAVEKMDAEPLGPMTPNGYDDISPTTRGEWGFLFSGESGFKGARTVGITTF